MQCGELKQTARRTLAMTGVRTQAALPVNLHSELEDARVARAVVFAEESAQRASRISGALATNVVADVRLVVAGEDGVAGEELLIPRRIRPVRHDQIGARVDARKLRVVESVEGFQPQLQRSALV